MVRWPGQIKPGSTSDAVVGPIDLYPTILDVLSLAKPESHVIDGESLLPILKQTGSLERKAYFTILFQELAVLPWLVMRT